MRRIVPQILVAAVASGFVAAAVGGSVAVANPNPSAPPAQPVREQNVDASGAIRVHEQGTANVNVTNSSLPVTVANLPATQNVNIVGGAVQASTPVVNGAFNSGILFIDEVSTQRITLDPPIYATLITVNAPEQEESTFRFRASIPGAQCAGTATNCTVLLLKDVGGAVTQALPFPTPIDRIDVFCREAGAFLDSCMPEIVVAGLKP